MSHLLDTNICSAHLKRPAGLTHYFIQHSGRLFVPMPVVGELYTWANHRKSPQQLIHRIENELLKDVVILDFDKPCAIEFGRLNGQLLRVGITINPVDLMIASVALVHDLTLVTHNARDFRQIPGLRLEDWLQP
jgi:tRNA(fMet)-specific endonuclease VapC